MANDAQRLKRLKSQLNLVQSIAHISKAKADESAAAKSMRTTELAELGPIAISKLKSKDGKVTELTKKEICALAFTVFGGVSLVESHAKPALVESLERLMLQQPSVMEASLAAATPSPNTDTAPPKRSSRKNLVEPPKKVQPIDDSSKEDDIDDSSEEEGEEEGEEEEQEGEGDTNGAVAIGVAVHVPRHTAAEGGSVGSFR